MIARSAAWGYASICIIVGCLLVGACSKSNSKKGSKNDPILATSFGKDLTLSQISELGATGSDSLAQLQILRDNWIKESLWAHQAEKAGENSPSIDSLVESYRQSLYLDQYKQSFISQHLDSTISQEELKGYYDKHESEFVLQSAILSADLIRFPLKTNLKREKVLNRNGDLDEKTERELDKKIEQLNGEYLIKKDTWTKTEDLWKYLPKARKTDQTKRPLIYEDQEYAYWMRIDQKKSGGENAPISFVADEIKIILLQQRTKKMLQEEQTRLYQEALDQKQIHIN